MGGKNKRNGFVEIRRGKKFYNFYFLKPPVNSEMEGLGDSLIAMKEVEEVFLTDGDFGYIVKARFNEGNEPSDVERFIQKRLGNRYGRVTTFDKYGKY
ncbi:MAG: hypothetical protein QXN59_00015 [Candidatus Micrarchaeaceae archaeon]